MIEKKSTVSYFERLNLITPKRKEITYTLEKKNKKNKVRRTRTKYRGMESIICYHGNDAKQNVCFCRAQNYLSISFFKK